MPRWTAANSRFQLSSRFSYSQSEAREGSKEAARQRRWIPGGRVIPSAAYIWVELGAGVPAMFGALLLGSLASRQLHFGSILEWCHLRGYVVCWQKLLGVFRWLFTWCILTHDIYLAFVAPWLVTLLADELTSLGGVGTVSLFLHAMFSTLVLES